MATRRTGRPQEPQASSHLRTYGYPRHLISPSYTQLFYDRWAFCWNLPVESGAPPRHLLFRQIADQLSPHYFEWHEWTDRLVKGLCYNQWVGLSGCASSAKTRNVAGFACLWWLCAPAESSVLFCSTTAKALRKRGWSEVLNFYSDLPNTFGNMVSSQMIWKYVDEKGIPSDKCAIAGIAVEEGQITKVADNIKGWHTRRQMVIIDEATAVPPAIYDAVTNLWSGCEEFLMVLSANPRSRLDEFGRFIEPSNGWDTVSVDSEEWETTPKFNGAPGIVLRFDAEKSPNITEGKIVSRWLPTKQQVESRRKSLGYEDDPTYWSNQRGFPPPEGLDKAVFSEVAILKAGGYERHKFTGARFMIIGALDPARLGGDRPTIRFGALGEIEGGDWGLEWLEAKTIRLNAKSPKPIDYQIVDFVRQACTEVNFRGSKQVCDPANFGVDASGGGADLVDIMQREWSPDVIRIVFNAAASEDAVSREDSRPCNEVYRNKRTEMYYRSRKMMDAGQLKGIDPETARELCSIGVAPQDEGKPLIVLMDKEAYRRKFHKSCDLSDSGVILGEVARKRGFTLAPRGNTVARIQEFDDQVKETHLLFETIDYSQAEPPEEYLEYASTRTP